MGNRNRTPSAKVARAWVARMQDTLKQLDSHIDEIVRVSRMPGPGPLRSSAGGGPGNTGEHSDPTAGAALSSTEHDLVADWVDDFWQAMRDARNDVGRASRHAYAIAHRADQLKGRQVTGGDCELCQRYVPNSASDRLRSGFCDGCYRRWKRWVVSRHDAGKDAGRVTFIRLSTDANASNVPGPGVSCD